MKIQALSNLFTKNIGWKIISLVIAFALWFICMNIINPIDREPISVQLEIIGEDRVLGNNYIILNQPELNARRVTMTVQATRQRLDYLRKDNSDLRAYIDLRPVDISQSNRIGEPMSVSVKCEAALVDGINAYTILNFSPMTVDVILDRLVSESIPITVERLRSPHEGYVAMDAVVTPDKVRVTGAQSLMETIASIGVGVNLEDVTDSVSIEGEKLTVYDKNGKDITNQVGLSVDKVNINVPVLKYARIPINPPTFTGEPADGYDLSLPVKWEPQYLEVVGDENSINELKEINIDTIDLTGRTESETIRFDMNDYMAGENMSIRNGTPSTVEVFVTIEQEVEKEIEIPLANLRYKGMTSSFELPPGNIKLLVRGSEAVIAALDGNDVQCNIDLTGLAPGTHRVPVEFSLPEGVAQVQPEINLEVHVLEAEEQAAEEQAADEHAADEQEAGDENAETEPSDPPSDDNDPSSTESAED